MTHKLNKTNGQPKLKESTTEGGVYKKSMSIARNNQSSHRDQNHLTMKIFPT
jgi:hypothetical protein